MRRAADVLSRGDDLREGLGYTLKRRLLGPPMVNEQLATERLSRPLALGVLSCDGISSANYGSELILHELLPFFGLAAFTILLPMTGVILLGIALVVLSYREVVTVYTRAGGSYVVARENFGPRVAQVARAAPRSCPPSRPWASRWATPRLSCSSRSWPPSSWHS